ncbi:MAG: GAF domain-containing protein [Nitrospirae bacterium]|nr:GAF domain-containing protein [Nitrospirota bacterium]
MDHKNFSAENYVLFEKKFSILDEISNTIVATDNINVISNLMLDLAVNYTNAEKGSLMLLNSKEELSIFASRGIDPYLIKTYRIKIGEGIAGTVAKNRVPVLVTNIEKDNRFKNKKRDRYKTRSFISCPIVIKNKLLGVININDKKDKSLFTEDEFSLLKTIANQAAIILENAFLMNQLKTKAAELEDINKNLIETDIIKTEFLTRTSHELRTPLNSINGAIYYLQHSDKTATHEQKEFFHMISNETGSLSNSIENLLDFLKLEDEAKIIKKSIVNFSELLNKTLDTSKLLKTVLTRKNLHLNINSSKANSDIIIDKTRFAQFFINLISGMTQYLEKGDTIELSAFDGALVTVTLIFPRRLPETVIPHFFDSNHIFRFSQPEEQLKLYLARKISEYQGWKLHTENTDNSFTIALSIPQGLKQKTEMITRTTMDMFIELISEMLDIDTCSIMLSDNLTGELTITSAKGLDESVIKQTRIKPGDKIAGWVALKGSPLLINNIESDMRFGRKNIPQYNTKSLLSLPLKTGEKVIGVLNLNNKRTGEDFTKMDLYIASVLSERISHFIEKLYSGEYKAEDLKQTLLSLEGFINAAKKYQKKTHLLPDLSLKVMDRLGADEEDKKKAIYISTVYDLGLTTIDESLLKKEKLSLSDSRIVRTHPSATVSLLNSFEFSDDIKNAILHHHERYDGTGYPDRLKGEDIPLLSRVLSVVDAFCAMTSERPYRKAIGKERSLQMLREASGSVFDPKVVEAVGGLLNSF